MRALYLFPRKEMIPVKITNIGVSIDLTQPVQEVVDIISVVLNHHPSRHQEILEGIDVKICEALANLQRLKEPPLEETEDKAEEVAT
ncbi:hypothetical protein D3C76_242730 [compost metagenome]